MNEFLRYGTPWCLAVCGTAIALAAMFSDSNGQDRIAAFGVATTALAGAAGLARSPEKGDVVRKADNVDVQINE